MNSNISSFSVDIRCLDMRLGSLWPLPTYATVGSAGLDLRACLDQPITLMPQDCCMVNSGIAIHIKQPNIMGMMTPRSGLGHKGLILGNSTGIIDSDYQGPITLSCWNRGKESITIAPGDRIAQLILVPIVHATWNVVSHFPEITDRSEGGFGSSGTT